MKQYSKGGDPEVSGIQALCNAHFAPGSDSSLHTAWSYEDTLASLTGIFSNPVSLKEDTLSGASPTEAEQIERIAKLSPGIYSIRLRTEDSAHAILLHIEDGNAFIVDPNIGLLRCPKAELQELLCMVLSDYAKPLLNRWERLFGSRNDHHLAVNRLSAVPMHWKDSIAGPFPISIIPTSDLGPSTSKASS